MFKRLIGLAALAAFLALPARTSAQNVPPSVCNDGTRSTASGKGACSGHGGVNHAATKQLHDASAPPAPPSAPNANTTGTGVTCKDGTVPNTTGKGACANHGGFKTTGTSPNATPPSPNANTASTGVTCKDGTVPNTTGKGACANHGGFKTTSTSPNATPAPPSAPPGPPPNILGLKVTCADGTKANVGANNCVGHGGVKQSGG
jgi:hypothetical protein